METYNKKMELLETITKKLDKYKIKLRNFISELGCFCNKYPNHKIAYNIYLFLCSIAYYRS